MKIKNHIHRLIPIVGVGISCLFIPLTYAQEKPSAPKDGEIWYNGERLETIWFADDQLYILNGSSQSGLADLPQIAGLTVVDTGDRGTRVQLPDGQSASELLQQASTNVTRNDSVRYAAVYLSDPEGARADALIQTGEVIVIPESGVSTDDVEALVVQSGLNMQRLKTLNKTGAALFSCPSDRSCLEMANTLRNEPGIQHAYPNWIKTRPTRNSGSSHKLKPGASPGGNSGVRFTVDDPLFPNQWHLDNTGQSGGTPMADVNIQDAWDLGLTGCTNFCAYVGVVDDGLEIGHEDLSGNEVFGEHIDLVDNDTDPSPGPGDFHGTAVGGISAAKGDNATGVSGAAPDAGLIGIRLLGPGTTDADEAAALTHNLTALEYIDVYNNSWGPADNGDLHNVGPLAEAALADGVVNGREGRGAIYTWAGGNGGGSDNSNYDGYANSRYTIAVAASDHDGVQSSYSEPGANVLINTPSSGDGVGTTTTDITGADGYDLTNYTSTFGGTSSAAPLAAGVIALMYDQNPALGWRDVQKILALTAEKNDAADADWSTNGAGHLINHKYGFGTVDAGAAVAMASSWTNLPGELSASESISPAIAIPDVGGGSVTIDIPFSTEIQIESVYLTVESDHTYWGDLEIVLISPDGTESILAETHNSGGSQLSGGFRFSSVRHMDEYSSGIWQVRFEDGAFFDTGSVNALTLEVFGVPPVPVLASIYISPSNPGDPAGVGFAYFDEDIIVHDGFGWSMFFDGSDVGLGGPPDLNAFHLRDDGTLLMSFDAPVNLGGTLYDDSDIVQFTPFALGTFTDGSFSMYFDGSAEGFTTIGEDIDAITENLAGELVVSTLGSAQIPRFPFSDLTQQDDDLARRRASDGLWLRYFDGSDVGFTFATEDIWGAQVDQSSGILYLTTLDAFTATGLSGDGNDIFTCTPGVLGSNTTCPLDLFWDGDLYGLAGERIDALAVDVSMPSVSEMGLTTRFDPRDVDPVEGEDEGYDDVLE